MCMFIYVEREIETVVETKTVMLGDKVKTVFHDNKLAQAGIF